MKKTNAVRLLDRHKIAYSLVAYQFDEADLSVEKIAHDNQLDVRQLYKTLVAKGDKTGIIVPVIPGDQTLSFKALAKCSGNKKVRMVLKKEIETLTGYRRGGCSPLGMKKKFPVFIDANARSFDQIYINAGVRGLFIKLAPKDLERVSNAAVFSITSE